MELRIAEPGDAEAIAAVLRDAFVEFEPLYTPAGFRATTPGADELRARWIEGPVWIALHGGTVVGTVSAVARPAELYIRSMAVHPSARGRGLGERLLHAAEQFAVAQQCGRLLLSTTPFLTAAIRLYERQGFQRVGEADLFGTPLLLMAKQLVASPAFSSR